MHLAPKDAPNVVQQFVLAHGAEHVQRLLVDVDDPNLLHAARNELGVHLDESFEITDALGAHLVHEALDSGEILHPQRDRRMLEQVARITLTALDLQGTAHLGSDVIQRNQNPVPRGFVPREDTCPDFDIQTPSIQSVIHRLVRELRRARP